MTEIFTSIDKWLDVRRQIPEFNTIGLVPTMGNLHAGHQSLLMQSIAENAVTVLTIFVNPCQFNDQKDFINYPKTFEQDLAMAEQLGVDYVLAPKYDDLYLDDYKYRITETDFSRCMEGEKRPGHFDGVLTVVMKLLMLVKANKAYFGEKDFQQLRLVEGLTKAFFIDTEIVPCQTVRDEKGLALSSRNSLLTREQFEMAHNFPKILAQESTIDAIIQKLKQYGFVVEYVEEHEGRRFGAVKLGEVRLIDNMVC